jgi:4-hydroxymandelate oxidase
VTLDARSPAPAARARGAGPEASGESGSSLAAFAVLGDLEAIAATRVPEDVWAYVQGGAGEERTLAANRDAFRRWTLRPRVLADVRHLDFSAALLGERVDSPFFIAPTAYQGLVHPDGELATARAARSARVLAVFSTMTSFSLERIAEEAPGGPRWFQLYLQPEFSSNLRLVERAERAGYSALVLTVDMPIFANRDRQIRAGFAFDTPIPLGNGPGIVGPARAPELASSSASLRSETGATWEWVDRLREATRLPLVLKGLLTAEDARRAAEHGAAAVVVSNHGGRQLDGAPAALDALPEVVAAVGSRLEVYVDGGIRRGSDVLIALALGARAVGLGRPALWALAAGGEAGVARWLALLKTDLAVAMALTGRRTLSEIDSGLVARAP